MASSLEGIHFMLPTPFKEDGELDTAPFDRLTGAAARAGCRGVVCLGVMGEAHRLTDDERRRVADAVVAAADKHSRNGGALAVTVGISSESHRVAAMRARDAKAAGATAVMAAPARLAKPNPQSTYGYYAAIAGASDMPLVVQDLPEQTGVHMDPQFIAKLNSELPAAKYLKLEDPPTPPKVTRVLEATGRKMSVFGGLGGAFLFEELRRGAAGTMTGFAYPEVLVAVHRRMAEGDTEGARRVFYKWLPLIRYENQTGIGLSIRKHIMAKRGFLDSPAVRTPSPAMDEATREELEDVLAHLDLNVSRLRTPIAASCPAHSPVSAMSRAFRIRPIEDRDRADVVRVLTQSWHSSVIVTRGRSVDCSLQPGLVAEIDGRLKGLVTYHLQDGECEVLSLDSLQEGIGIGTALLDAIAEEARASGCRRAFLITTNDNIGAIRFYQKRGWRMVAVYPGAVDKSRKIKPAIPLTGSHGIAIRDEIEFELRFGA